MRREQSPAPDMHLTVRPATPADAAAVRAMYAPIVRQTAISFETEVPDDAEMAKRVSATLRAFPWLLAERGGTVVAYAYAAPFKPRAAYRWSVETTVYVAASARGRGVGQRLYAHLLPQLAAQGYVNAFAGIALPNPGSVALHERVGFRQVGVLPRVGFKHGAWHDVGWWHLTLREPPEDPEEPRPPGEPHPA